MRHLLPAIALATAAPSAALAEAAPFDLTGPTLRVTVTHEGRTLPIARVPQLAAGDRVDVRADLPKDQSAHYLLVAAFLRGSTNPPPDKWFTQVETWKKKGAKGLSLAVPEGAQQIVLFLAPETGGDFPTLRNAVQGKPGAFVRAAQDLAQASLDRRRLDTYLAAVRKPVSGDPDRLERITPLLARSLQVKVNTDCLSKAPELQAACLLQNQDSLVLNDGHTNAITEALAGPGVDLALQFSATPQGGLGYYSPYIAAVRDIIGLFSSIRTAKYQYIPALATLDGDRMGLILNAAPSFHNPKSVLVAALPIVSPIRVPPLEVTTPEASFCARAPEMILPIGGAPLIYATNYAHDLALRVTLPGGKSVDLPAEPDAERGGLVVRPDGKLPGDLPSSLDGSIHGQWGFQSFDGPQVRLQAAPAGKWQSGAEGSEGKSILLSGGASACVTGITAAGANGAERRLDWRMTGPDTISATMPPGGVPTGGLTLKIAGPRPGDIQQVALAGAPPPKPFAATVIARHLERPASASPVKIGLGSDQQVVSDARLTVSLHAGQGLRFTSRDAVEIAAGSGATTKLTVGNGLTLADPQVAVLTLEPAKSLGTSAFGPLQARIVRDGSAGDWLPLGTLVRLPALRQITCPADATATCELSGDNLFLLDAVSATPGFEKPVPIPEGYPGNAIQVPHPLDGTLYLRLHDAPDSVSRLVSGATADTGSATPPIP